MDLSYLSGHTSSAFSLATVIALFVSRDKKWIGILSLVTAAMIGFSRLYLGVHYPTDVICGMVLGIIFGISAYFLLNKKLDTLFNNETSESL